MGVEEKNLSHDAPGADSKPTMMVSHIDQLHPRTEPIHMITLFDSGMCVCLCGVHTCWTSMVLLTQTHFTDEQQIQ